MEHGTNIMRNRGTASQASVRPKGGMRAPDAKGGGGGAYRSTIALALLAAAVSILLVASAGIFGNNDNTDNERRAVTGAYGDTFLGESSGTPGYQLEYKIIHSNEVAVFGIECDDPGANVIIPDSVTHDGVTYTVVSLSLTYDDMHIVRDELQSLHIGSNIVHVSSSWLTYEFDFSIASSSSKFYVMHVNGIYKIDAVAPFEIRYYDGYGESAVIKDTISDSSVTLRRGDTFAAKPGYRFAGWDDTDDGTWAEGDLYPSESTTVTYTHMMMVAVWEPLPKVSFDLNGGEGTAPEAQTYPATLPDSTGFYKRGYLLEGWCVRADDASFPIHAPGSAYDANVDRTLYAIWTPIVITYDANGGQGGTTQTMDGEYVTLSDGTGFSITNQHIARWRLPDYLLNVEKVSYALGENVTFTRNVTLYAAWTPYIITYDPSPGTIGIGQPSWTYATEPLAPAWKFDRGGYTLIGWETADSTGMYDPGESIIVTDDTTLYAAWVGNRMTVSYNTNGPQDLPASNGRTGLEWILPDATQCVNPGYTLDGWSTTNGGEVVYLPGQVTRFTYGVTVVHAVWSASSMTVTFNENGGTASPEALTSVSGVTGGTYALPTASDYTRRGYTLTGWSVADDGTADDGYGPGEVRTFVHNVLNVYAIWSADPMTITFSGNGGTGAPGVPASASGVTGGTYTLPSVSDYTRPGYTLAGWSVENDGSVDDGYGPGDTQTFTHGITDVYAVWSADPMAITFNGNGGTGTPAGADGRTGETYALPSASQYTRPGYTLAGWSVENDGSVDDGYGPGDTQTFTYGITDVYAVWSANGMTVTFNGNGGTASPGVPEIASGVTGETYTLPSVSDYTRPGYTLAGWSVENDGMTDYGYDPGSEQTFTYGITSVYAVWSANEMTVTFNGNGGEGTPLSVDGRTGEEYSVPDGTDYAWYGHTLEGWSLTPSGEIEYELGSAAVFVYGENELFAVWSLNTYTITYLNGYSGGIERTVTYGDEIGLEEALFTRSGYYQSGWKTEDGTEYGFGQAHTVGGDLTLYAVWSQYTITYNDGLGNNTYEQKDYGNSIPLSPEAAAATLRPNYHLIGWKTVNEVFFPIDGTIDLMQYHNVTLYALWNQYMLTFYANDGSGEQSAIYGYGDIALDGTDVLFSRAGHTFAGWNTEEDGSGDGYSVNQTYPLVSSDADLYAVWTGILYSVTLPPEHPGYTITVLTQDDVVYGGTFSFALSVMGEYEGIPAVAADNDAVVTVIEDDGGYTYTVENITSDVKITISGIDIKAYKITIPSGSGYDIDLITEIDLEAVEHGSSISFTIRVNDGYEGTPAVKANGVSLEAVGGVYTAEITDNVTISVSGILPVYTITYDANGGTGTISPQQGTASVTLSDGTGFSRPGYKLAGWSAASSGEADQAPGSPFTLTEDTLLYAVWIQYAVTYHDGTRTMMQNGYGETELFGADTFSREGYVLKGWALSDGGDAAYGFNETYSIQSDADLYAVWELAPATETDDPEPEGGGSLLPWLALPAAAALLLAGLMYFRMRK